MTRRGLSSLEVVLASVVLVLFLLPLMSLSSSYTREAGFLEFHLLAATRARALVDLLAVQDLVALEAALTAPFAAGPDGVDEVRIALPPDVLGRVGELDFELPGAKSRRRSELYSDELMLGRLATSPSGRTAVFRLRAVVRYAFPTDPRGSAGHTFQSVRLLARPGLAHQVLPAFR